ncbi:MAG: antibiotic biosynthesis monooxygenase [Deltaproteobacteria bacterium]|uniref:putative quinol monooxygenase n=1 Tax=Desulfobacula sp. TaxID=2593537 RepID=UPI0019A06EC0|nr:antibiotic biosynthesis monooxygenase [Candidatus Desulfobacula maris]MBL6992934.1 antibiotic biosynthesis monooxygenase [Desulfobacula sp.]
MITLMAKIIAKQGNEADLEAALSALVKEVEAEEGTLEYVLNKSQNDPCRFMVFEVYKDDAALKHHGSTDYFKKTMKESAGYLAQKPVMEFYTEVIRINR